VSAVDVGKGVETLNIPQQYKIMQRGFVTLENLYSKKRAQVLSLRQALQEKSEEYESTTNRLLDELDVHDKKIQALSAEVESKGREVKVLSTELEAARGHIRGAEVMTTGGTKESVSQAGVIRPRF